ncbi:MAG: hypothetical protein IPN74_17870 [Haliscomenobacter sp.]|nr:hypothetical protein [Haliscomenobacter sp.]
MQLLSMIGLIFLLVGVSFLMINVRQLLIGKEFHGTCSSNNPMLRDKIGNCTVCGKTADEACKMPEAKA